MASDDGSVFKYRLLDYRFACTRAPQLKPPPAHQWEKVDKPNMTLSLCGVDETSAKDAQLLPSAVLTIKTGIVVLLHVPVGYLASLGLPSDMLSGMFRDNKFRLKYPQDDGQIVHLCISFQFATRCSELADKLRNSLCSLPERPASSAASESGQNSQSQSQRGFTTNASLSDVPRPPSQHRPGSAFGQPQQPQLHHTAASIESQANFLPRNPFGRGAASDTTASSALRPRSELLGMRPLSPSRPSSLAQVLAQHSASARGFSMQTPHSEGPSSPNRIYTDSQQSLDDLVPRRPLPVGMTQSRPGTSEHYPAASMAGPSHRPFTVHGSIVDAPPLPRPTYSPGATTTLSSSLLTKPATTTSTETPANTSTQKPIPSVQQDKPVTRSTRKRGRAAAAPEPAAKKVLTDVSASVLNSQAGPRPAPNALLAQLQRYLAGDVDQKAELSQAWAMLHRSKAEQMRKVHDVQAQYDELRRCGHALTARQVIELHKLYLQSKRDFTGHGQVADIVKEARETSQR